MTWIELVTKICLVKGFRLRECHTTQGSWFGTEYTKYIFCFRKSDERWYVVNNNSPFNEVTNAEAVMIQSNMKSDFAVISKKLKDDYVRFTKG